MWEIVIVIFNAKENCNISISIRWDVFWVDYDICRFDVGRRRARHTHIQANWMLFNQVYLISPFFLQIVSVRVSFSLFLDASLEPTRWLVRWWHFHISTEFFEVYLATHLLSFAILFINANSSSSVCGRKSGFWNGWFCWQVTRPECHKGSEGQSQELQLLQKSISR